MFFIWRNIQKTRSGGESGGKPGCMAPQSCVMNPAQGAPGETPPEDRGSAGELCVVSPVRCKSTSSDLPFSVESLMSDRGAPPGRSPRSPVPGSGCVRTEECASPRGVCGSKLEAVDLSETEAWLQGPSPTSKSQLFFKIKCRFKWIL